MDQDIDKKCALLCETINKLPGIRTVESCCGHGEDVMRIYIMVDELKNLAPLLYYIDSCHVGFDWDCKVYTDCGMCFPRFYIESHSVGKKAYEEANEIAKELQQWIDEELEDYIK